MREKRTYVTSFALFLEMGERRKRGLPLSTSPPSSPPPFLHQGKETGGAGHAAYIDAVTDAPFPLLLGGREVHVMERFTLAVRWRPPQGRAVYPSSPLPLPCFFLFATAVYSAERVPIMGTSEERFFFSFLLFFPPPPFSPLGRGRQRGAQVPLPYKASW